MSKLHRDPFTHVARCIEIWCETQVAEGPTAPILQSITRALQSDYDVLRAQFGKPLTEVALVDSTLLHELKDCGVDLW